MQTIVKIAAAAVLCGAGFMSCEDVIDINLKDNEPKLVIEGWIDNSFHGEVRISRTVPFDQPFSARQDSLPGSLPGFMYVHNPVSGAEVIITEPGVTARRLTEISPGLYVTATTTSRSVTALSTPASRSYQLAVRVDGEWYNAVSTMPPPVEVETIGTVSTNVFGEERKGVGLLFNDPPGVPNYYRYLLNVNGVALKTLFVFNDKYNDGKSVTRELFDFDTKLEEGDAVNVSIQFIDPAVYRYWSSLQANNPGTAAPGNPVSNISNGALGYFSAHSVIHMGTIIQ